MSIYVQQSAAVIDSFRESELFSLVDQIMKNRKSFRSKKISSVSRDVYRLGSFDHQGVRSHAILKLFKEGTSESFNQACLKFEPHLFSIATRRKDNQQDYVEVPRFAFLRYLSFTGTTGIIMEDLSEGKYEIAELKYDTALPFAEENHYLWKKRDYTHTLLKVLAEVDFRKLAQYVGVPAFHSLIGSTGLVVHNGSEFKRIVCADADQLYPWIISPESNYTPPRELQDLLM